MGCWFLVRLGFFNKLKLRLGMKWSQMWIRGVDPVGNEGQRAAAVGLLRAQPPGRASRPLGVTDLTQHFIKWDAGGCGNAACGAALLMWSCCSCETSLSFSCCKAVGFARPESLACGAATPALCWQLSCVQHLQSSGSSPGDLSAGGFRLRPPASQRRWARLRVFTSARPTRRRLAGLCCAHGRGTTHSGQPRGWGYSTPARSTLLGSPPRAELLLPALQTPVAARGRVSAAPCTELPVKLLFLQRSGF